VLGRSPALQRRFDTVRGLRRIFHACSPLGGRRIDLGQGFAFDENKVDAQLIGVVIVEYEEWCAGNRIDDQAKIWVLLLDVRIGRDHVLDRAVDPVFLVIGDRGAEAQRAMIDVLNELSIEGMRIPD
jgi:hypothetical protein